MKTIKAVLIAAGAIGMLQGITSCSSDPNPTDYFNRNHNQKAYIQLDLSVAETRADNFLSDEEKVISKVNIFVFDSGKLELTQTDQSVVEGKPLVIEASSGIKVVYAISANNVLAGKTSEGMSIADFENLVFNSKPTDIKTDDGFVMIGKSEAKSVLKSTDSSDIPATNQFIINLTRTVAKAQVKFADSLKDNEGYGLRCFEPSFRICQTNNAMRVVSDGTDVWAEYTKVDGKGTFDQYTEYASDTYSAAVKTNFTADGCQYASENIVGVSVSGNTTYISLKVPQAPLYDYAYNAENELVVTEVTDKPAKSSTFYAVGAEDAAAGYVEYAKDYEKDRIFLFSNKTDADKCCAALNGGSSVYNVMEFTDGEVYYRINIVEGEGENKKYQVLRNKFYKINVTSVNSLGFPTESLLSPTNPEADLETTYGTWISTSFTVADWDSVDQAVDL